MQRAQNHQQRIRRTRGLRGVKRGADLLEPTRVEGYQDPRRRQGRVAGDELGGQGVEPGAHRLQLAQVEHSEPVRRDQPAAQRIIPGGNRMTDRLGGVVVLRVPLRSPPVQYRGPLGRCAGQLVLQQAAEQVVVPEPAVLVVQRDHEQVGAVNLADQLRAVGPSGERVAQRRTHTVEH